MNLAIISPFPPTITGIGQYGYHVSRALARSSQFTRISILAGRPAESSIKELPYPIQIDYAWKTDSARAGLAILHRLRKIKPDLVWYNLGASVFGRSPVANLMGFMSLSLVKSMGLPTIVTLHELVELADLKALNAPGGVLAPFGARTLTYMASRADVICLTMSRYVKWFSTHRPKLTCLHIPIGAYHSPEILPSSGTSDLLFFTTLAPYKGLDILLEAYGTLRSRYPNLRVTIAGTEHPRFQGYGGSLREKYKSLPGVRWLGQVAEDTVRDLFTQAQMVVLPYTASTGSSSVLVQAAMWGRPIVASDLSETCFAAEENDLMVEYFKSGAAKNLAEAIQSILDDPARARGMVKHNFQAIQHTRPEETCRLYLQAFNLALENCRSNKRLKVPVRLSLEL